MLWRDIDFMNINSLFDHIPQCDAFFTIFAECHNVNEILPEFEGVPEQCICIYGVTEESYNAFIPELNKKWEKNINTLCKNIPISTMWEQRCKPIFLFENKEIAIVFMDYANTLNEENFVTFISELQCDYNTPLGYVKTLKSEMVYDLINHYDRRFFCD